MSTKVPAKHSCGGDIVQDAGAFTCLGCGQEWVTNKEKHSFYEQFRPAIQAGIIDRGVPATRKAWKIPSGTFSQLLKKWTAPEISPPAKIPVSQSSNHLPELPPFSNDWVPEVQVKWLEVWGQRR